MGGLTAAAIAGATLWVCPFLADCHRSVPVVTLSASGLPMDRTLGLEQTKSPIDVPLGRQITLVLRGTPDTGYRWRVPVVALADAFSLVDHQEGEVNTWPLMPLPSGQHSWLQVTLRANKIGRATIRFRSEGNSDDGEPADDKVVVRR